MNGTRVIVRGMGQRVLDCEIISGSHINARVFIPRITLSPSEDEGSLPFKLKRRQFPIRPAFAMTINKAQGQTLQRTGLFLPTPVFSHGQLYTGLSRVGSPDRIVVALPAAQRRATGNYVHNVVYKEILN